MTKRRRFSDSPLHRDQTKAKTCCTDAVLLLPAFWITTIATGMPTVRPRHFWKPPLRQCLPSPKSRDWVVFLPNENSSSPQVLMRWYHRLENHPLPQGLTTTKSRYWVAALRREVGVSTFLTGTTLFRLRRCENLELYLGCIMQDRVSLKFLVLFRVHRSI